MKYIKILPVWLCVLCLIGCYEKGNEISKTTETSSVGKTEETTLQESYANGLEDEESDSIEKIEKYKISEQTFDVYLDDWGEVTFVSCEPAPDELNDWKDALFYLIKNEQILYKFPYRFENNSSRGYIGIFDSVGAVAFRDVNDDKKRILS